MTVNINDTGFLVAALEQSYGEKAMFKDTFFPNILTSPTKEVFIDYRKGSRKLAPFVTGSSSGVSVSRNGFKTLQYVPPLMMPKMPLSTADLEQRAFGENFFAKKSAAERAMDIRTKDLKDLRELNDRRLEWMCAKLMTTGKVPVKGYSDEGNTYIDDEVTYDFTQKETLTGNSAWNQTTATPYADLRNMFEQISTNGGRNPDVLVMSSNVEQMLLSNSAFLKMLDTRYLNVANFTPKVVAPGVRYLGTLSEFGLECYIYTSIYVDESGTTAKYLPDDYCIMGVSGRGSQLYGAVTQVNPETKSFETYEGRDVPKIWVNEGEDVQMLRLARRVMPKPEFIDDWYTLKVK